MNQRALVVTIVLFLLIVGGMFGYAYLKRAELYTAEPVPAPPQTEKPEPITHIDAKHWFRDGTHTVAGEILMPTPCELLEAEAIVAESNPEQAMVKLTVLNDTKGVCPQTVTPQRFKVSFTASQSARIDATLGGMPVILNLVEARPDENPDDFEVNTKG